MDSEEQEILAQTSYIDEDGVEQAMTEPYNPEVGEDVEPFELDTTANEMFKIDENMPEELKKQLETFNRYSANMNSIISDLATDNATGGVPDDYSEEESTDDYEMNSEESSQGDNIVEEDVDIGNLF